MSKNTNKKIKQVLTFVLLTTNEKSFVGIPYQFVGEDHTDFSVSIITKSGLLTFDQNDIVDMSMTTKEEFDLSVVDIQQNVGVSKSSRAKEIYKLNVDKMRRCDVIRLFMKELDMSEKGASTYFQNIRKSLK